MRARSSCNSDSCDYFPRAEFAGRTRPGNRIAYVLRQLSSVSLLASNKYLRFWIKRTRYRKAKKHNP